MATTDNVMHDAANDRGTSLETTPIVILAGGRGARLAPYTSVLPKPLMPVGERAILELVVDQLSDCGITDITFCVGYLSHLIRAVFESRENGHVRISYVQEQEALGTAGPLRLVEGLDDAFIAMNGDVLTDIDYADLVAYHREHGNALTIATHRRSIKIDYGVLRLDGQPAPAITAFDEKPEIQSMVSMGIYVVDPLVLEYLPEGGPFDLPDLVQALLRDGQRLGAYVYDGLWFDIGRKEDYEQAVAAWIDHGGYETSAPEAQVTHNGNVPVATAPPAAARRRPAPNVHPNTNGHSSNGHSPNPNGHSPDGSADNGVILDNDLSLAATVAAVRAGSQNDEAEWPGRL